MHTTPNDLVFGCMLCLPGGPRTSVMVAMKDVSRSTCERFIAVHHGINDLRGTCQPLRIIYPMFSSPLTVLDQHCNNILPASFAWKNAALKSLFRKLPVHTTRYPSMASNLPPSIKDWPRLMHSTTPVESGRYQRWPRRILMGTEKENHPSYPKYRVCEGVSAARQNNPFVFPVSVLLSHQVFEYSSGYKWTTVINWITCLSR